ncbi:MAG: MBL fold metallo-hydrolase [Candidatus Omnitrophica bacterium]|nr:MBL fold metallo-hydrolase [Candidatus Omnitrophota bacterium]
MAKITPLKQDYLKFLGTAGARFVMIKQLRSSGGLWISCSGTNLLVDPGPGSIVRCASSRPKLDPLGLDAIILTHCHLDHSGDVNVMIEAMTEGGFKKKGIVFAPPEALGRGSVIFSYLRDFPEKIEVLSPRKKYKVGKFVFETSMPHIHPITTFGLKFRIKNTSVSLLTDTRYFPGLTDFYNTDILIISVVFAEPRPDIDHLSLADAQILIKKIRPKKAILTHFGMTMLKAGPRNLALELTRKTGIEVLAAYDGMTLDFPES